MVRERSETSDRGQIEVNGGQIEVRKRSDRGQIEVI